MNMSFRQSSARTSVRASTVTPRARAKAARRRSTRSLGAAAELAEADPGVDAGVADVAGGLDPGDDAADAAEHALGAEHRGELVGGLDAVEQGDDEGVGAEERA